MSASDVNLSTMSEAPPAGPGLNYLCPSFKLFFGHVQERMRDMKVLLAQNRAPAELMTLYVSGDVHRGRNEPCTCGGGRKWKRCHGPE